MLTGLRAMALPFSSPTLGRAGCRKSNRWEADDGGPSDGKNSVPWPRPNDPLGTANRTYPASCGQALPVGRKARGGPADESMLLLGTGRLVHPVLRVGGLVPRPRSPKQLLTPAPLCRHAASSDRCAADHRQSPTKGLCYGDLDMGHGYGVTHLSFSRQDRASA